MAKPEQPDGPEEPQPEKQDVHPELAAKIQMQLGMASLALAQAVTDICNAVVCREVEKLRTQCREFEERLNRRLEPIEEICRQLDPRPGIALPPDGSETRFRAVDPSEFASRIAAIGDKLEGKQP